MNSPTQTDAIDLQPHPRVLSVLGDIEFAPWQCLAELIDNAFDEFLRHPLNDEQPTVNITLPGRNSQAANAEVWVSDNGPGLTVEQLQNALRAGWTSNDRFGRLGLFGMGFNVATARLGNVTTVRTARADALEWTVVTIDLPAMQQAEHFVVPVRTEPKSHLGEHGTTITIKDLKPELHDQLSRQQKSMRDILGDVYSYLLTERDFKLVVDGKAVQPRRACVWGSDRSVVRNREVIPAYIEIDEHLGPRLACLDCGLWQDDLGEGACSRCHNTRLERRERRIWGWLGIQRYTHKTDFGIDFLRNGRKILLRDKSMFDWIDPDDPTANAEREYPVEVPYEGRIVGEIHVDHVPVAYQKNAFEKATTDWARVRRTLRGDAPLRPKKATELGYPANTSHLARLFAGYRRTNPGLDYLVPGDGRSALSDKARAWAELFRKGDPDFQTDERWYEAAKEHDNPPTPPDYDAPVPPASDAFQRAGLDDDDPSTGQPTPPPAPPSETEEERRQRWRAGARPIPDLQSAFGLRGRGTAVEVAAAWRVFGHQFRVGPKDRPGQPVYIASGRGATVELFIDDEHPIFTEFAVDMRDLVTMALADYIRTREDSHEDLGALFAQLKEQCLPDHRVSGPFLKQNADRLIARIRETIQPVIEGNSTGYWALLPEAEQAAAQHTFAMEGGRGDWDELLEDARWLDFVPAKSLVRLVSNRPESFLDGRAFRTAYASLTDAQAQHAGIERITGLLADVAALSDLPVRRTAEELQRGRLSIALLTDELASELN